MKKTVLFLVMVLGLFNMANAQRFDLTTLFESGVNEDTTGWTFYLDPATTYGGGGSWGLRTEKRDYKNEYNVISTHVIGTGSTKYDWAVLPVQDLSYYQNVQLNFIYLKGKSAVVEKDVDLTFYAMDIADGDLTLLYSSTPVNALTLEGSTDKPAVDAEVTVSIPNANIGEHTYIAIGYMNDGTGNGNSGDYIELKKVYLSAEVKTDVTGVSLNKSTATVTVGGSETLTATVLPDSATFQTVVWSSSDTLIATVDENGKVSGIAVGSATITATTDDGGYTATCAVTVQAASIAVTGISLDVSSLALYKGDEQTLVATITPSNATNQNLEWKSSDTLAVTVDENGKVTAVGEGSSTVTVTTEDGGYTATCAISSTIADQVITGFNDTTITLSSTGTQNIPYWWNNQTGITANISLDDDTYLWEYNQDDQRFFKYVGSGAVTVQATLSNSGNDYYNAYSKTITLTVTDGTSSITETEISTSHIYPNPASDMLNISLDERYNATETRVTIYNLSGKRVLETAYSTEGIALSNLSGGIYFIKINDKTRNEILKFVKK